MGDLAAIMARRRAAADEEGGMYFNSPPASRNNTAAPPPQPRATSNDASKATSVASKAPPSHSTPNPHVKPPISLQQVEDAEEEEEEEFDEIEAYQQKLRQKDEEASFGDVSTEVQEYQMQLRSRDEADAVAGLATGTLSEIVSKREAPKSGGANSLATQKAPVSFANSPASFASPQSARSALGGGASHDHFMASGPEECTCSAGSNTLCAYCLSMNGPASMGSVASTTSQSLSQPASNMSTPTMPGSYSSFAGLPSQKLPANRHHMSPPPGWSEKASLSQHGSPSDASSIQKAKKEKKSGVWSCCFRPAIEEDDDKVVDRHSWGSEKVPESIVGDELVDDGVPLGGVTSTSEDVMDEGGVILQCNVGLSAYDAPQSGVGPGPMSSVSMAGGRAPLSTSSAAPLSWNLQEPTMPASKRLSKGLPPSSGTSLFSVAENSAAVIVNQPHSNISVVQTGKGRNQAPISASLQQLQGLDDRRNQLMNQLNKGPPSRNHAPISSTLLELQQRQIVPAGRQ